MRESAAGSIAVATVSTAATTTATATAATTAAATTATIAAAARTRFTGLSFVDSQPTAIVILVVQSTNCFLSFGVGAHLDESESTATTRFAIRGDLSALNAAKLRKQLFQVCARDLKREIPDIELFTHRNAPEFRREHRAKYAV